METKQFNKELEKIQRFRNKNRRVINLLTYLSWVCIFMQIVSLYLIRNYILGTVFFIMCLTFIIIGLIKNEQNYRKSQSMLNKLGKEVFKK